MRIGRRLETGRGSESYIYIDLHTNYTIILQTSFDAGVVDMDEYALDIHSVAGM